ncbi:MAG: glycosyltransferase family 39 protein [Candidatus Kerfeldbacteria bacterium]|nr:glycosyltransferase family 39 protein [Candidatus Kerfeldbacteria bacterium]
MSGWFFVRGIDFGLPDLFHDDEHFIVEHAVTVASGSPHLTWFDWPGSSLIYLNGSTFVWLNLAHNLVTGAHLSPEQWLAADHADFYLISRMITVAFAFGVLILTILIGRAWKNVRVGLAASALLGVSVIFTRHAHYATPDIPLTFFILLATYAGLRLGESGMRRWVTLGAAAIGIGAMTKYPAIFAIVPLIIGHIHAFGWSVRKGHALHFVLVALLSVTIASPFFWTELPTVWQSITGVSGQEHVGRSTLSFIERIHFYVLSLGVGVGNTVLLVAGTRILSNVFARRWKDWLIALTALAYGLGIVMIGITWERWILPVAPLLALLAASSLASVVERFVGWRTTGQFMFVGLIVVLMLPSFARSLIVTEIFASTENDTRFQTRVWIVEHLPKNTRIIQEKQTPRLPSGQYRTGTYQYLANVPQEVSSDGSYDYAIVSSEMYSRFFANDDSQYADERDFYRTFFDTYERVFSVEGNESGFRGIIGRSDFAVLRWFFTDAFSLRELEPGPDISIYKL